MEADTGVIVFLGAVAVALFSIAVKRGLKMREDN
jgi:hypothetical protein